jgi:serine/threonine-protein kinase
MGALALATLVLTASGPAAAQTASDSAAAQSLFDQARALMAKGHAAEACPKLEESQRLDPGTGTLLNLARCYELTNRLASAWSKYLEAASSAQAAGNVKREKEARKRADALVKKLAELVIDVAPEGKTTPGLQITRDGQSVGAAQWGMPIAADEGKHSISASAPGHESWEAVTTVSGAGSTTTVTVPKLVARAVQTPPPAPRAAKPAPRPSETEQPSKLGTQRILALVAGGVGVVGIGVGTVFGLQSKSKHDEAEKSCDGGECTDEKGVAAGEDARAAGNVSTVTMIVGAAALAGGAALWFTAPKTTESTPGTQVGVGLGTLQLKGVW